VSLIRWNWQRPDWPNFSRNATRLRNAEEAIPNGYGRVHWALKHLPALDQEQLTIEAVSTEAVTASEIEG
jgi:hypothetical protein